MIKRLVFNSCAFVLPKQFSPIIHLHVGLKTISGLAGLDTITKEEMPSNKTNSPADFPFLVTYEIRNMCSLPLCMSHGHMGNTTKVIS